MSYTRVALAGMALLIAPALAQAQQAAATFDQLRVLVEPGETLWVTDMSGTEFTGRLLAISSDAIEVEVGREPRRFGASEVQRVTHRATDGLTNGMLIGAAVGAASMGSVVLALCADDYGCEESRAAAGFAIYAGLGAGIGALVDALHKGKRTAYQAPIIGSTPTFTAGPILTSEQRGAWIALRF